MIKKIHTIVSTNKKVILKKVLLIGGCALGLIAGALLVQPEEETIIIGETVEDNSTTNDSPEN